jgi:hypothetical protein
MSPERSEPSEYARPVKPVALSDALTFWTAPHPAWTPNPEWPEDVGFATWRSSDAYVFIDPLVRDDLDGHAWDPFDLEVSKSQSPVVLLTAPWHERSVRDVAARYDAPVWIHPTGRNRLADLPELTALPSGVECFVPGGIDQGQVAFHIVPERTLVVAEFFLGTDHGLQVAPAPGTPDLLAFTTSLDRLRDLSIERVLVAHGPSILSGGNEAIRDALDAFGH